MERTTMSVQELSAQMGISLPKAYELVKTPGFPTLRIGTRILIPIDTSLRTYYSFFLENRHRNILLLPLQALQMFPYTMAMHQSL